MSNINQLLLLSGQDIAFNSAKCTIHQPRINEISMIGERAFHTGSNFLAVNKNSLNLQDTTGLEEIDNFNIFMAVMNNPSSGEYRINSYLVLNLLFPNSEITIDKEQILLQNENSDDGIINEKNFKEFQYIINKMFCIDTSTQISQKYNPADIYAKKIADKIRKGQEKRNSETTKASKEEINIFSRYISILSIGLQKDKNELANYTVYQLLDEFERYRKKYSYDIYLKAKMAGASELEEVENWMEDIHL